MDMLVLALAAVFKYSVFDTALPPPYDYLQETSELVFGDKTERERAFFGTYPRAVAPLQIITPPAARVVINPIKSLINNDWDRFLDYHIHTMYPFGRLVRQVDKTIYDPKAGDSEIINDADGGQMDTLNLENIKTVPSSEKRDNILNYGNNLPESINTSADSSDLKP